MLPATNDFNLNAPVAAPGDEPHSNDVKLIEYDLNRIHDCSLALLTCVGKN